jgi:hypothetical protein
MTCTLRPPVVRAVADRAIDRPAFLRDLRPSDDASLDGAQVRLLEDLESFEAPYLEEKLLAEGVFASSAAFDRAFVEFKKFVALRSFFGRGLGMASEAVDEVWHQLILFTQQYHEFCDRFLGEYFHHSPKTSLTPLTPGAHAKLVRSYRSVFGAMPADIWRSDVECNSCCESCNCGND